MRHGTDHRSNTLLILQLTVICSDCMSNKNIPNYKTSLQQAFLFYSLQLFGKDITDWKVKLLFVRDKIQLVDYEYFER